MRTSESSLARPEPSPDPERGPDGASLPHLGLRAVALFGALFIVAAVLFTEGERARSSSPRRNWALIWTGVDGDRYFVDTSTVKRDGAAGGHGTLTAFYVPPLILHRRTGISTQIREDVLTFDCARETLNGGATWRRYDVATLGGRVSAPDSIFADSGQRTGPRRAALEYACRAAGDGNTTPTAGVTR